MTVRDPPRLPVGRFLSGKRLGNAPRNASSVGILGACAPDWRPAMRAGGRSGGQMADAPPP